MNTDRVLYFLTVAKKGSFSAAAQQHFVSQSAISLQIAELEKELGCKLFTRTTTGVIQTPEGRKLIPLARTLIQAEQQLKDEMARLSVEESQITVAYTGPIEKALLMDAFIHMYHNNPKLQLQPAFYQLAEVSDALIRGACDVALTIPSEMKGNGINCDTVAEYDTCAAVSVVNPLAEEKAVRLHDLISYPFVILNMSASKEAAAHIQEWAIHTGFAPDRILYSDSIEEQLFIISMNQGISILPNCAAIRDKGVRMVPIADYNYIHRTIIAYRRKTPVIETLISFLKASGTRI